MLNKSINWCVGLKYTLNLRRNLLRITNVIQCCYFVLYLPILVLLLIHPQKSMILQMNQLCSNLLSLCLPFHCLCCPLPLYFIIFWLCDKPIFQFSRVTLEIFSSSNRCISLILKVLLLWTVYPSTWFQIISVRFLIQWYAGGPFHFLEKSLLHRKVLSSISWKKFV